MTRVAGLTSEFDLTLINLKCCSLNIRKIKRWHLEVFLTKLNQVLTGSIELVLDLRTRSDHVRSTLT